MFLVLFLLSISCCSVFCQNSTEAPNSTLIDSTEITIINLREKSGTSSSLIITIVIFMILFALSILYYGIRYFKNIRIKDITTKDIVDFEEKEELYEYN